MDMVLLPVMERPLRALAVVVSLAQPAELQLLVGLDFMPVRVLVLVALEDVLVAGIDDEEVVVDVENLELETEEDCVLVVEEAFELDDGV